MYFALAGSETGMKVYQMFPEKGLSKNVVSSLRLPSKLISYQINALALALVKLLDKLFCDIGKISI